MNTRDKIPSSHEALPSSGGRQTTNTTFKCPVSQMVISAMGTSLARNRGKNTCLDHGMGVCSSIKEGVQGRPGSDI